MEVPFMTDCSFNSTFHDLGWLGGQSMFTSVPKCVRSFEKTVVERAQAHDLIDNRCGVDRVYWKLRTRPTLRA
eukprot:576380-Rhodomonas_salina.1